MGTSKKHITIPLATMTMFCCCLHGIVTGMGSLIRICGSVVWLSKPCKQFLHSTPRHTFHGLSQWKTGKPPKPSPSMKVTIVNSTDVVVSYLRVRISVVDLKIDFWFQWTQKAGLMGVKLKFIASNPLTPQHDENVHPSMSMCIRLWVCASVSFDKTTMRTNTANVASNTHSSHPTPKRREEERVGENISLTCDSQACPMVASITKMTLSGLWGKKNQFVFFTNLCPWWHIHTQ